MATTPNIYDFIIYPIRLRDQQEGKLFLERFLAGPQTVWETTREKIQSVKTLWSLVDCPDAYLKYLKYIVGWTKDLDGITKDLDALTLRRLISLSVQMWKSRATESSICEALNLLVPGRARILNWFFLRWILDETVLGEEHQGRDSYLLSMPEDAYWSNIRIVDNPVGTVDRTLIKTLLNLMRPVGERFEIIYLKFLDLFDIDGDVAQWDQGTATALLVEDGMLKLRGVATEATWANVEGADTWANYVVGTRIRALSIGSLDNFGITLYQDGLQDLYYITINISGNKLNLGKLVGGTPSTIVEFDFSTIGYEVHADQWYLLRAQILLEGATNRIRIFVDGEEYINTTDSAHSGGTVGLMNIAGTMLDCDEIEVLGLPVDSETVEINY